jgi:hypothetical protein
MLVAVKPCLAENERQRHGEAAGMGGADQLLGIGARKSFEAAGKAVRVGFERAALRRDLALAILDAARPLCGTCAIDLHAVLLLG